MCGNQKTRWIQGATVFPSLVHKEFWALSIITKRGEHKVSESVHLDSFLCIHILHVT